jgi:hypothetical protein
MEYAKDRKALTEICGVDLVSTSNTKPSNYAATAAPSQLLNLS